MSISTLVEEQKNNNQLNNISFEDVGGKEYNILF